ncbi:MAG TPA: LAGLIDADG family homing endonuclease, partial [Nodularia sp. (in: cyanobacteria)]|nr:LAGLIDADG family homing endonuclease [Nodularia sp. (in: cyanobacteria)]
MAKKKGVSTRQKWEEAALAATKKETVQITLSLAEFVRESWQVLEPSTDLLWNWHIDVMCWHIQETLLDWFKHKQNPHYVQRIQNLLINVPPGSLKSRCLSVCTPAWMWTICPSWRAIFLSSNPRVALRDSVYCRDVIESDWYQKRFSPDWKLRVDNNSKSSFWNTKGGVRSAFGFNSRITGDRGDFIAWDDPHDAQEVNSELIRQGVIDRWDSAIRNRVNDLKSSVRIGIMQRLHECLLPKNGIITDMGIKIISVINPGDRILTSAGFQSVIATRKKPYKGDIIGITAWGYPETLWCTPEHLVLTDNRGWVEAGKLLVSDLVVFPSVAQPDTADEFLQRLWLECDFKSPPKLQFKTLKGKNPVVSRERLQELVDEGFSSREIAEKIGVKTRQLVDNYIALYGITKPGAMAVPASALKDPGFWRLVGYWLAEGCLGMGRQRKDRIRLTFSSKEIHFVEDIRLVLAKYNIPLRISATPNVYQISFASYQIAHFLNLFGEGAKLKRLPEWAINLPEIYFREMLLGYWRGDGCYTNGTVRISSVSLELVSGFQRGLLRIGILATVRASDKKERTVVVKSGAESGRVIKTPASVIYDLRVKISSKVSEFLGVPESVYNRETFYRASEDRFVAKLRSIESDFYEGEVYDLETPCHDFVSGIITVHNCDLSGHVLKQGSWVHLCVPQEFEKPFSPTALGWVDPRTESGELMFPERFSSEILEQEKKALGSYGYAGQHQQRPAPADGGHFKRSWWKYYKVLPDDFELIIQSWDCTFKDTNKSDYVVGQVWGKRGGQFYLLDQVRDRMDFPTTIAAIRALSAKYPNSTAKLVEDKANGPAVISSLEREIP